MTLSVRELFEYTLRHVSADDIRRFCPDDPGYPDYVRAFTAILSSGVPPKEANFDITETISLTIWGEVERDRLDPVRFRRFRAFTIAVGLAVETDPEEPVCPPNYLAIRLLEDAQALQDETLLRLLPTVFADLQCSVIEGEWNLEEIPFLLLGQLLLAFQGFSPSADVSRLAEELTTEAARHAGRASPGFFWGCTYYDQLHDRWKDFVRIWFPENFPDEAINSLRAALLCSPSGQS